MERDTRAKSPLSVPISRPLRHEVQRRQATVTIPRALAYLALVGLAVLFLWLTLRIDLVIFAGVLFGICLRRAAEALSRVVRLPVGWSLLAVVLLIFVIFAAIGWFFAQGIASQIDQLSRQLPVAAQKVASMISQSGPGKILMQHLNTGNLQTSPTNLVQSFFGVAANVVEVVGGLVVVIALALYFAAEATRYARGLVLLVPPPRRSRAAEILHEAASAMWYWMLGRLFSMTALGAMTAIGLWLLGVPLPIALGFLAGIMIFVPYIGSAVSAIPSVLIAASINFTLAIYVIGLYVAVHVIEGYILVPLVQRRVVRLPPGVTLSAQVILGVLGGFLGLLFATPLAAATVVIVRMLYIEDILGDRWRAESNSLE
jgi:predicted PurR-regulated permease PerM